VNTESRIPGSDGTSALEARARGAVLVLVVLFVTGVVSAALIWPQTVQLGALAPLLATGVIALGFLLVLWHVEDSIPYFELGVFYAAVTVVYAAEPLLRFVLAGYRYIAGDSRLVAASQVVSDAIPRLTWWYVLYLLSFCLGYLLVRGRKRFQGNLLGLRTGWTEVSVLVLLLAGIRLYFFVLQFFFSLEAESYAGTYLVVRQLPLFVRQLTTHAQGIDLTLRMMLVIALVCMQQRTGRILLGLFLLYLSIAQILNPTSRAELLAVLLAALAARHLAVRRLTFPAMVASAVGMLALLTLLGAVRTVRSTEAGSPAAAVAANSGPQSNAVPASKPARVVDHLADNGEFECILGNAADLQYVRRLHGVFLDRPTLYWSGITALVPQQLLPVRKETPWDWYVRTFWPDYHANGGGFAFGVVAQAVAGFGWPEMIVRGLFLGCAFALLHRWLFRGVRTLLPLAFSIWITIWSYSTLRLETLALPVLALYHFLVPAIAFMALTCLMRRRQRSSAVAATRGPA
jgi:hypothetical protein